MSSEQNSIRASETVFQLCYASAAKAGLLDSDVEDILKVARQHNQEKQITGALLLKEGIFLQLLEGDESRVKSLYSRIVKDLRHHNVVTLFEATDNPRVFIDWSMAYGKLDSLSPSGVKEVLYWTKFLNRTREIDNDMILQIFNQFKSTIDTQKSEYGPEQFCVHEILNGLGVSSGMLDSIEKEALGKSTLEPEDRLRRIAAAKRGVARAIGAARELRQIFLKQES